MNVLIGLGIVVLLVVVGGLMIAVYFQSLDIEFLRDRIAELEEEVFELGDDEEDDEHTTDTDCTIDRETQSCVVCGVSHANQCNDCFGRGFHNFNCPRLQHED